MSDDVIISAAPVRRHIQRLIDDSEGQRYGSESDYRAGKIYAYHDALRTLCKFTVNAMNDAAWADMCARYASDSDYGRGLRDAYTYLRDLFRDYADGQPQAWAILTPLGDDSP